MIQSFFVFLSLSCNKSISFLICWISFCILFCCVFGIFILYTKKKNYTGVVIFFNKLFHVKTFVHYLQNSLGRNRMPEHLFIYLFFECSGTQFFNSLTCDLRDTMPRQRLLLLLPREVEVFPRGDRHFKHVPLLTYLIYLSPKE